MRRRLRGTMAPPRQSNSSRHSDREWHGLARRRSRFRRDLRRLNFSRSGRIYKAVVAAFDARMIFVAGDQQDGMCVVARIHANARDLAPVVDADHIQLRKAGVWGNKGTQINHGAPILP